MNGTTSHHSKSSTDFTNDGEPPTVELLKQLDELTGQTPAQRAQRQRLCDEIIARTLPVADRLAAEATTFRRAYCQYPVCGPTRASFLTGLYPESTGVFDNRITVEETRPGTPTLPRVFRDAGFEILDLRLEYDDQYQLPEGAKAVVVTPTYAIFSNAVLMMGAEPRAVPLERRSTTFTVPCASGYVPDGVAMLSVPGEPGMPVVTFVRLPAGSSV